MLHKLCEVVDSAIIKENVPMSKLTTFKIGGNADIVISPRTVKELKDVVKMFYETQTPYYVLGNGSNLLISDEGVKRPVIVLGKNFASVEIFDDCISAKAGTYLSTVAKKAAEASLRGFEFAAGIPGTLGGALYINAGAYGQEMKDVVEAVSFIDPSGEEYIVSNEEMEFSYRHTALFETDCIITGATLKLEKGSKEEILSKMADLSLKRRSKQPLEYPSAGSVFKRPAGHFAGALIESTGLKGKKIGGAMVSEKHAGFIINTGNATAKDVCALIEFIKEEVYKKHGVLLETEVEFWE